MTNAQNAIPAIRTAIKAAGFKARVRQTPGSKTELQVCVPEFDARFTGEQIAVFCTAALAAGLTFVQNTAIDVAHEALLVGKQSWEFYG